MGNKYGYNDNSIRVVEGAAKHRLDPAQHLGSRDAEGIQNQLWEFFDNSVDESDKWYKLIHEQHAEELQGRKLPPLEILMEIKEDWSVVIEDMGRGFPCGYPTDDNGNIKPGSQRAIFSALEIDSAGGKSRLSQGGYDTGTAGMHGAGAAVAKSCTTKFEITTKSGPSEGIYYILYIEGKRQKDRGEDGLVYLGELSKEHPIPEYRELGIEDTGTRIEYKYDPTVLSSTTNGQACNPYSKLRIIDKIKDSLMGLPDRDCLIVRFIYQGEEIVITPYDRTPEEAVGYDPAKNGDTCIYFEVASDPRADGTPAQFSARMYVNMDVNGFEYTDVAIVNRLRVKQSTSTKRLKDVLYNFIYEQVEYNLEVNERYKDKGYEIPGRRGLDFTRYFKTCTLLNLAMADFSGQQKDILTTTEYLYAFEEQVTKVLNDNVELFAPVVDTVLKRIEVMNKAQEAAQKEKVAPTINLSAERQQQNVLTIAAQKEQAARINSTKEGQVESAEDDDMHSRISIFGNNVDPSTAMVCFLEGKNAADVLAPLVHRRFPVVGVSVQGKLMNIFDLTNDIAVDASIAKLIRDIFILDYSEYLLLADPDPDGEHIKMILLGLIATYTPHMLQEERVFVIRAPYARITIPTGTKVVIQNEYEGTLELTEGAHYVSSYGELQSALAQGASCTRCFTGVQDVMSNCEHEIPLEEMLTNPKYKVPIKAPTPEELKYLQDMLTPDSEVKKVFTNQFYTERKLLTRSVKDSTRNIRLKTGSNGLTRVNYSVTETPIFSGYKNMSYFSVLF